jgi:hypothetical protein
VQAAEWVKLGGGLCVCNPHFLLSIAQATHTVAVRDWCRFFAKKTLVLFQFSFFVSLFWKNIPDICSILVSKYNDLIKFFKILYTNPTWLIQSSVFFTIS